MNKTDILLCFTKISHEDDHTSFKELYRFYFVRLFRFCQTIVHNKESAEEIVHNVFMKLWERRATAYQIENPDVFLYVSVKNSSIDYLRKSRSKKILRLDEIRDELVFSIDPERLMIQKEVSAAIRNAIMQLPPRCRQIFCLIREDGLKYKDVADILNLSIKTVESQMAIAVKKLATAILKDRVESSFRKTKEPAL